MLHRECGIDNASLEADFQGNVVESTNDNIHRGKIDISETMYQECYIRNVAPGMAY